MNDRDKKFSDAIALIYITQYNTANKSLEKKNWRF